MLDIIFSHSYFYKFDQKQWNNKTPYPPLGTIYAAAYLRKQGYSVGLYDTNLLDNTETLDLVFKTHTPSYFVLYDDGFNYLTKMCLTNMREAAFKMIKKAKALQIKVIVCSSDATDHYEKYIKKGADFIIQGEGEETLKVLINTLEDNAPVDTLKGIVFKKEGKIITNPKRPVVTNLDALPLPAWDLVDMQAYKNVWREGKNTFTLNIATTRGCPYKCNWCAKPIYGNRYNSHSPAYIVNHIAYLKEHYNVNRFWMCDDIFGLKPNWVNDFNTTLKKHNLSITYTIQSRADLLVKTDTVAALAESGLKEVWIGAESGSQSILDAMDKGITVAQIETATRLVKAKNIRIAFFIQFGYLKETKKDINKTIAMIKKLVPDNIGVSVSYPLPGTKFYDKVKDDLKLKANWTDSDDLAMLFEGTYNTKFYRKLQRYVHKEFRKSQALLLLKSGIKKPLTINKSKLRIILLYFYYGPSAFFDQVLLKKMEHKK